MSILVVIGILAVLVVLHELGHFIGARLTNMAVKAFSIFFPPNIFRRLRSEVEFRLGLLPLGGYVQFAHDERDLEAHCERMRAQGVSEDRIAKFRDPSRLFNRKSGWAQLLMIMAGPVATLACGIVFGVLDLSILGQRVPADAPVIAKLTAESAQASGLMVGDRILSVNGTAIARFVDISPVIQESSGETVNVEVLRQSDKLTLDVPVSENSGQKVIGIAPHIEHRRLSVVAASIRTVQLTGRVLAANVSWFAGLVSGESSLKDLSGPIGVTKFSAEIVQDGGASSLLFLATMLSLMLFVANILPIPVLDGGNALYAIFKILTKRQVPLKAQAVLNLLGLILLISSMIYGSMNDLQRL